jgi:hypothetical protein
MKTILSAIFALATSAAFAGSPPQPAAIPSSVPPVPVQKDNSLGAFAYDYLELGWNHVDFDQYGEGDGYNAAVSVMVIPHLLLWADWAQNYGDVVDTRTLAGGAGFVLPLAPNVHWVTTAGAGWTEARGAAGDADDTVFVGSTGLRVSLLEWLEVQASYNVAAGSGDTVSSGSAALLFDLGEQVQFVASGSFSDDATGFGAGIRYHF